LQSPQKPTTAFRHNSSTPEVPHEILKRGAGPLDILEEYINDWISETLNS
jgi:hypothetical protein